jgi:hypothetical protein
MHDAFCLLQADHYRLSQTKKVCDLSHTFCFFGWMSVFEHPAVLII